MKIVNKLSLFKIREKEEINEYKHILEKLNEKLVDSAKLGAKSVSVKFEFIFPSNEIKIKKVLETAGYILSPEGNGIKITFIE